MTTRVALFFAAWCALSLATGIIAGRIIAAAHRHPTPPVPPHGRPAAVEPATELAPSQAPALPPEIVALIDELHRQVEDAKVRYVAANGIRQLEAYISHPSHGGDDCNPHGISRPEIEP